MKPQELRVAADYRLALLWLMDQLGSASQRDVMAAFDREFGAIIPAAHQERGHTLWFKWQNYVAEARQKLIKAGLMDTPNFGLWGITPAGKKWIEKNPGAMPPERVTSAEDKAAAGRPGFTWQGKWYAISDQALLARARQLLGKGPPQEALRYVDWAVLVDGQPVSVKWLFSLATSADYEDFDSPTARRALTQIGIQVERITQQEQAPRVAVGSSRKGRVKQRDEFLARVASYLSTQLPAQAKHGQIRTAPGRNLLQVVYPDFPRSHYELWLARDFDQVAFHLEGKREDNLARLAVVAPHQEELTSALGLRVAAEPWGPNWAWLAVNLPSASWTEGKAKEYAALLARFIGFTFPIVRQAFAAARSRRGAPAKSQPAVAPPADGAAHAVLDRQLAQIRAFLQGRSLRPSDEALCDWVHFCYTFELFSEGQELFNLVVPSAVNDWLYARTRRLALVCRMRAGAGRQEQG